MTWPLTSSPIDEANHTKAFATASTFTILPRGMTRFTASRYSLSVSYTLSELPAATCPGEMELKRIPNAAYSSAMHFPNTSSAAFADTYEERSGHGLVATHDDA